VKAAAAYAWGVKSAEFEMLSQMETEAASEDITMVSFRGPWGVCGRDAGEAGWTRRGVAGEGPGVHWAHGGKGLRKTTGRLEKLGSRLLVAKQVPVGSSWPGA
jgi:hypothetical protein